MATNKALVVHLSETRPRNVRGIGRTHTALWNAVREMVAASRGHAGCKPFLYVVNTLDQAKHALQTIEEIIHEDYDIVGRASDPDVSHYQGISFRIDRDKQVVWSLHHGHPTAKLYISACQSPGQIEIDRKVNGDSYWGTATLLDDLGEWSDRYFAAMPQDVRDFVEGRVAKYVRQRTPGMSPPY